VNLTNLALLAVLALSVNYVNIKNYEALICLLVVAVGVNFATNKLLLSLVISIVVTNLLVSMNHLKVREGLTQKKKDSKKNKKVGFKKEGLKDLNINDMLKTIS